MLLTYTFKVYFTFDCFYSNISKEVCSSAKNIRCSLLYPSDIIMKRFKNPCRSLEKASYKSLETILDRIPNDTFEMKFEFNSRYKEIVEQEQVDLEVLILFLQICYTYYLH